MASYSGPGAGDMESAPDGLFKVNTDCPTSSTKLVDIDFGFGRTVGMTKSFIIGQHGKLNTINPADHVLVLQPGGKILDDTATTESLMGPLTKCSRIVVHPKGTTVVPDTDAIDKNLQVHH